MLATDNVAKQHTTDIIPTAVTISAAHRRRTNGWCQYYQQNYTFDKNRVRKVYNVHFVGVWKSLMFYVKAQPVLRGTGAWFADSPKAMRLISDSLIKSYHIAIIFSGRFSRISQGCSTF
jgi:hypothetical protein